MMCSLWGSYQHAIVGLHNMERNVSYASSAVLNFFSGCYLFPLNSFCFFPPHELCVCSLWVSGAVQLCPWLWLLRVTFLIILLPSLGLRFVGKANAVSLDNLTSLFSLSGECEVLLLLGAQPSGWVIHGLLLSHDRSSWQGSAFLFLVTLDTAQKHKHTHTLLLCAWTLTSCTARSCGILSSFLQLR